MRAAFFATCVVDQLMPNVGLAALRVLERRGLRADFPPDQTCCGQPFFNAGYRPEARRLARATLRVLAPYDAVVVPSGSCAAMIRLHYAELFAPDDPEQDAVASLARRTFEFSEFLVNVLGEPESATGGRFDGVVTFHDGCHALRELGVRDGPRTLLAGVSGCALREMEGADRCCGFGGSFAVAFDDISASMGQAKADAVAATGADAVVSCDPSCLLQIRGVLERRGIRVKTLHLAEVLAGQTGEAP
jgi:L-lactate dehydrogenase complex protein LldE